MRLLMTTDTVGGVWTFTSELTQQLLDQGHSVHLVSFGRQPSAAQQAWADQQTIPVRQPQSATFTYTATDIPLEWMQANDRAFEDGQAVLCNLLRTHSADLILSNQLCFGRLETYVPRIVVAHSDVLSWARACHPSALEPSPWLNRYSSVVQAGLMDADAVVTPTGWMGKALKNSFFLPRHYVVIPNGVSLEPALAPGADRKLQAITAGRLWDEGKGLDTLCDLASPIPLLVAGDNTLDSAHPEVSWPAHLRNLGPLSPADLHQHFRESAVYVCPSRYEPFGLAPLEAALCGCALVLRDLPSLREVWADNALYFSDNASLTHILRSLAADPHLLHQAQIHAHARAQLFTPERTASSYLHLFHALLQQQATPHVA